MCGAKQQEKPGLQPISQLNQVDFSYNTRKTGEKGGIPLHTRAAGPFLIGA